MRPLARSMLNDCLRAVTVDVSEKKPLGAFEPSLIRKIGSVPFDCVKIDWMRAAEIPRPSSSLWQLLHVRPFAPRFWKNGLAVSMVPVLEKTSPRPNELAKLELLAS